MLAKQSTAHQKPWSKHIQIPSSANFLSQLQRTMGTGIENIFFHLSCAFI